MIHHHGTELVEDLHWRYGGRIPFLIEGPIRDYTDRSYQGLFELMKTSLTTTAQNQLAILKTTTLSAGPELTLKNATENFSPRISPDGLKMILISKDDTNRRSVQILRRSSRDKPFDAVKNGARLVKTSTRAFPPFHLTPAADCMTATTMTLPQEAPSPASNGRRIRKNLFMTA